MRDIVQNLTKSSMRRLGLRRLASWLCLTLLVAWGGVAGAAPVSPDYRLGPDDVLSVTVLRHGELSTPDVTVDAAGKIDLPGAGQVLVAGKTTGQAARAIKNILDQTMVNTQVSVALKAARAEKVSVLGAVNKGGLFDIKPGWHVTEALAAAGGITGRSDETTAILARAGQTPVTINLPAIFDNPSSKDNRVLQPNDVLTLIPQDPKRVTVTGDVARPDVYPLRRAQRLLDALAAAGDLKQRASESRGYVLRKGQKIDLDLVDAVDSKTPDANIELKADDLIEIQAIPALRVTVNGLVKIPSGSIQLREGDGVIQAIAQAGGLNVTPDQVVVGIWRNGARLPVDIQRAALDSAANTPLQSGDLVQVDEPEIVRVTVTGQVNAPGAFRLPVREATVLNAIAKAGGLAGKTETAVISVLRARDDGSQAALNIDPVGLTTLRDPAQNIALKNGDLVSVTQSTRVVYVSGEVKNPGPYDIKEGDGVAELIARAGGYTEDAALTRVSLRRGTSSQNVDVYDALKNGARKPGIALQERDFVVVPKNDRRVFVMQAVQRPGAYPIPERGRLTVTDALAAAGGARDRAAVKQVYLVHPTGPTTGTQETISLVAIGQGDLSQDKVLQPGDIIFVPEYKGKTPILGALGSIVGTLTGLRFLGGG